MANQINARGISTLTNKKSHQMEDRRNWFGLSTYYCNWRLKSSLHNESL